MKAGNIPGFDGKTRLNQFEVRDYLMTQGDPNLALKRLLKKGMIDSLMERAVRREMTRVNHPLS
jgi:hypothetical protein